MLFLLFAIYFLLKVFSCFDMICFSSSGGMRLWNPADAEQAGSPGCRLKHRSQMNRKETNKNQKSVLNEMETSWKSWLSWHEFFMNFSRVHGTICFNHRNYSRSPDLAVTRWRSSLCRCLLPFWSAAQKLSGWRVLTFWEVGKLDEQCWTVLKPCWTVVSAAVCPRSRVDWIVINVENTQGTDVAGSKMVQDGARWCKMSMFSSSLFFPNFGDLDRSCWLYWGHVRGLEDDASAQREREKPSDAISNRIRWRCWNVMFMDVYGVYGFWCLMDVYKH